MRVSAWPKAVTSFGYIAPECAVQVPLHVFERLCDESPDRRPSWAQDALDSGADTVNMQARTWYHLIGESLPPWVLEAAGVTIRDFGLPVDSDGPF